MERVKSSDVLDPTHEVAQVFRAKVLGTFRRVGPNSWDDYEFVKKSSGKTSGSETQDVIEVLPTVPVQFENRGAWVRLRTDGKVCRVEFLPQEDDLKRIGTQLGEPFEPGVHARAMRQYFEAAYLRRLGQGAAFGAAAVIVGKLNDR
jgi:hypothetical protein